MRSLGPGFEERTRVAAQRHREIAFVARSAVAEVLAATVVAVEERAPGRGPPVSRRLARFLRQRAQKCPGEAEAAGRTESRKAARAVTGNFWRRKAPEPAGSGAFLVFRIVPLCLTLFRYKASVSTRALVLTDFVKKGKKISIFLLRNKRSAKICKPPFCKVVASPSWAG